MYLNEIYPSVYITIVVTVIVTTIIVIVVYYHQVQRYNRIWMVHLLASPNLDLGPGVT